MKKIYLCIMLFITLGAIAQNVEELEQFEKNIKPGTVLIYDIRVGKVSYQLTATLKKIGSEIVYDWKTSEPANKSGSVIMSATALSGADAFFHTYDGGESKLEKETSLWLSKKIQNELATNAAAPVRILGATDTVTVMSNTITEFGFTLNGEFINVPVWELESSGETKLIVGVIESNLFPIIYRLDLGWTALLTEVKSP